MDPYKSRFSSTPIYDEGVTQKWLPTNNQEDAPLDFSVRTTERRGGRETGAGGNSFGGRNSESTGHVFSEADGAVSFPRNGVVLGPPAAQTALMMRNYQAMSFRRFSLEGPVPFAEGDVHSASAAESKRAASKRKAKKVLRQHELTKQLLEEPIHRPEPIHPAVLNGVGIPCSNSFGRWAQAGPLMHPAYYNDSPHSFSGSPSPYDASEMPQVPVVITRYVGDFSPMSCASPPLERSSPSECCSPGGSVYRPKKWLSLRNRNLQSSTPKRDAPHSRLSSPTSRGLSPERLSSPTRGASPHVTSSPTRGLVNGQSSPRKGPSRNGVSSPRKRPCLGEMSPNNNGVTSSETEQAVQDKLGGLEAMSLYSPASADASEHSQNKTEQLSPDTCDFSPEGSDASRSSLASAVDGGRLAKRRRGHPVPDAQKDEAYVLKRMKNNVAAKKSREKRREHEHLLTKKTRELVDANNDLKRVNSKLTSQLVYFTQLWQAERDRRVILEARVRDLEALTEKCR